MTNFIGLLGEEAPSLGRTAASRNGALVRVQPARDAALAMLLKARNYARDVGCDAWAFAVEIDQLRALGLTDCDLRWLCCKGYIQHALEITLAGETQRSFRPLGRFTFFEHSCFVLTEAGVSYVRNVVRELAVAMEIDGNLPVRDLTQTPLGSNPPHNPEWDPDDRVLRVGDTIVKQFRVPAANQEAILSAFHEEHWPKHIDDPLPPVPEIDPKRRLHSAIHCLNRNQKCHLLHFHGDGYGTGVYWELIRRTNGEP